MKTSPRATRRQFLEGSAIASVRGALALGVPNALRGATDNRKLKIGLIGCGGRGAGAAKNALDSDPNLELTALADVFADRVERSTITAGARTCRWIGTRRFPARSSRPLVARSSRFLSSAVFTIGTLHRNQDLTSRSNAPPIAANAMPA